MRRFSIRPGSCPFRLLQHSSRADLTQLPVQSIMTWRAAVEDRAGAWVPPASIIKEGAVVASAGAAPVEHPALKQNAIRRGMIADIAAPRPSERFAAGSGGGAWEGFASGGAAALLASPWSSFRNAELARSSASSFRCSFSYRRLQPRKWATVNRLAARTSSEIVPSHREREKSGRSATAIAPYTYRASMPSPSAVRKPKIAGRAATRL